MVDNFIIFKMAFKFFNSNQNCRSYKQKSERMFVRVSTTVLRPLCDELRTAHTQLCPM